MHFGRQRGVESLAASTVEKPGGQKKRIIKVFETAPAADRPALYERIEGHPWEGDFRVDVKHGAKGVDKLFRVMDEKLRKELKDLINGDQSPGPTAAAPPTPAGSKWD
jgi:hypothetical protein